MDHNDGSIDVAVDELLAVTEVAVKPARVTRVGEMTMTRGFPMGPVTVTHPSEDRIGETTGVYDVSFFERCKPVEQHKTGFEHLADSRVGLALFLEEAERALQTPDLTVDQRLHISTIISYIDGLAARLDKVRVPGFVHPKKR